MSASGRGPVLFAYDGSELAMRAVTRTGELLGGGREALVACVWQPFDVGFVPLTGLQLNASEVTQVKAAAEQTADAGVELARTAGFAARAVTLETSPAWKGLIELADRHDAELIVLGSHGRHGASGMLLGSVAHAVASHTKRDVLIVHGAERTA